ncbi:hypothetical protein PRIPAC_93242 [Pristionchus pacificus]|uniref:Uncharacterized protein n=1 Tax=Pristionchus pacificus TaxID=54126 RepID=A0A2A6BBD5_PRIPA|nr:hypothetical protein PRIPAC_93242 [Pristionchus pacificus]|eukprot:PDM63190.1 hypothetical protein PRIPAC_50405 [Pristionchus pacificus]
MAEAIASVAVAAAADSAADDVAEKLHQELDWNKPVTEAAIHAGEAAIGVGGGIAGAVASIFRMW